MEHQKKLKRKEERKTVTWIDAHKKETIFFKNCVIFFSFMVWLPTFGIFNVHTDVDACSFTQRLYKHGKRVHWKLTGRKIPCRSGDSNPCQYCASLFSQMLYQLSYPYSALYQPMCLGWVGGGGAWEGVGGGAGWIKETGGKSIGRTKR